MCPALFFVLLILIGLINWPWPRHFASGYVQHFDPPFHTWKLMIVARSILGGHLLPEHFDSNMFFPSSLTLYYEALHWPESVFAAVVLALTGNPVLMYNVTHIVFWALSGCCMYLFLRQIGLGMTAAALGGALFCLIPYRTSYLVEFNMQLCFALPLFLMFLYRFCRSPTPANACGLVLAFWLQAVSELYQALILVVTGPLIALPLLRRYLPLHWKKPVLYVSAGIAVVLAVPLTLVFLWPYHILHSFEGLLRELAEITKHTLEPFSYILTTKGRCLLPGVIARHDEMSVYPTIAVLVLAAGYAISRRRILRRDHGAPPEPRTVRILRWVRLAASGMLAGLLVFWAYTNLGIHTRAATVLLNLGLAALVACGAGLAWRGGLERNATALMISGMGAGAILAFVMSLGPTIRHAEPPWECPNWIFLWMYRHVSALSGMRVVSRFSIVVMLFLVSAASAGFDAMIARKKSLQWLAPLILAMVMFEARGRPPVMVPFEYPLQSKALRKADERPLQTMLVLPFGDRIYDSTYMLQIGGDRRLMLYAWGGFYPPLQHDLRSALNEGDAARLAALLRRVWPPALLLVDRHALNRNNRLKPRFEERLQPYVNLLEYDRRFSLYELKPEVQPVEIVERTTRTDYLYEYPVIRFRARLADPSSPPATLCVEVNGSPLAEAPLHAESAEYRFRVPRSYAVPVYRNDVILGARSREPWILDDFAFDRPAGPADDEPKGPMRPPASPSPWAQHVDELPTNAIRGQIAFKGGIRLEGVSFVSPGVSGPRPVVRVSPGQNVTAKLFWKCAPDMSMLSTVYVKLHFVKDGIETAFETTHPLLRSVRPQDFRCQPYTKIFFETQATTIPGNAVPGSYALEVSLRDGFKNERIRGTSALPERHRKFRLPISIEIVNPKDTNPPEAASAAP